MPQRDVDRFQLRQIKLPHLRLIGNRQRLIQLPRAQLRTRRQSTRRFFQNPGRQQRVQLANPNPFPVQLLQEPLDLLGQERLLHCALQPGKLFRLLNLNRSLLKTHHHTRFVILRRRPFFAEGSQSCALYGITHPCVWCASKSLERETGIEPATNSLEGCDSTTELLPPLLLLRFRVPSQKTLGISAAGSRSAHARKTPQLMEPMIRIELMTSPLPRECSTN